VIDLHCHLLPAIDDGPPGIPQALALARAHLAAGVTTVAATPHVMPAAPNTAAGIAAGLRELRVALAEAGLPLEPVSGGEIDLVHGLELPDAELRALSLGGAGWLLIEAPLRAAPQTGVGIRELLLRGHRVLLAHPERSPVFQRDPKELGALVAEGVAVQVTAGALVDRFGSTVTRFARRLVDDGLCHVVASDAHDLRRRPPGMAAELEAAGLQDTTAIWCDEAPSAILRGEAPPSDVRPRRRRGGLRRALRR
jgi:protein-tyrosine phosphatase